ncbi:hypothetical protein, partial [Cupriavidus campinensis]|uniref:hypothetical protein n=1 Tax=Cupriavidus campinensis TaxID=151783 RepID=UPI00361CE6E9
MTRSYPEPLAWFAVHAGLLDGWQAHGLGLLLGQAISDGDDVVLGILRDTAGTQHPVARMGRHVPNALLSSTREEAWVLAEGLLLAAHRAQPKSPWVLVNAAGVLTLTGLPREAIAF